MTIDNRDKRIADILRAGGWYEGRRVEIESCPAMFAIAQQILEEYGGLHLGECGRGVSLATADVEFCMSANDYSDADLKPYENILGSRLVRLAEVTHGHMFLVIDEAGKTYLEFEGLATLADTFSEALVMLLFGIRPVSRKTYVA